jgi:hypothetical protein
VTTVHSRPRRPPTVKGPGCRIRRRGLVRHHGAARFPKALVTRIHAELIKVRNDPVTNKRLVSLGASVGSDPEAFHKVPARGHVQAADVVKKSGAAGRDSARVARATGGCVRNVEG